MIPDPFDLDPADLVGDEDEEAQFGPRLSDHPPMYTMEEAEVETTEFDYPDRTKNTYIVSGPLGRFHPARRGTRHKNAFLAELAAIEKFGTRFVRMIRDGEALGIWAAEVKKP